MWSRIRTINGRAETGDLAARRMIASLQRCAGMATDNVAYQPCSHARTITRRPPERERFQPAVTCIRRSSRSSARGDYFFAGEPPQRLQSQSRKTSKYSAGEPHTSCGLIPNSKERCEMRFGYRTSPSRRARSPSWNGFRMKWSIRSPVKKVSTVSLLYALVTITFRSGRVS